MTHEVTVKAWVPKKTPSGETEMVLLEKRAEVGDGIYGRMLGLNFDGPGEEPMEVEDMVLMDWFL